ncbi:hypothetical protein LTR84_009390 [Exophiala bonariae]|uniref:Vacuolar import and degradation protein 21 n=1 Tax=Exophiala bonariae TaxID=1690606 RepID=A0AAV9MUK1_9EURO|nr:hypothetical protein LTR84_009390 [Exophiala bonariae]
MHVEQLRNKKAEAQNRLLSRKRKLSELFSITAYQLTLDEPHYKQQLQAFHDANDLERGRSFDESTLPSRLPIVVQTRRTKPSQPTSTILRPDENLTQPLKTIKPDASPSPLPTSSTKPLSPNHERPPQATSDEERDRNRLFELENSNDKPDVKKVIPTGSVALDVEPGSTPKESTPSLPPGPQANLAKQATANESPGGIVGGALSPQRNALVGIDAVALSLNGSENVSAPAASALDTHSSPASTNGIDSSNTPAPTAGSPGTSPGVDVSRVPQDSVELTKPSTEPHTDSIPNDEPAKLNLDQVSRRSEQSEDVEVAGAQTSDSSTVPSLHLAQHPQMSTLSTSTKPDMRIDTQTGIDSYFKTASSTGMVESPAPISTAATPKRPVATAPSAQELPKRATRISSGVLQKKSVSEILGEVPKPTTPQAESPASPSTSFPGQVLDRDRRERERSRLSTVVFAKPQKPLTSEPNFELARVEDGLDQTANPGERDYLYTLFENKAHSMSRQTSMSYLIQNAHKTLSTSDHLIEYELSAECRILKRLYQLQEKQRWALRQYKRADEAVRPTSHWDFLLDHVKWLRTDFREERKWKMAAAKDLAECCAEWKASSKEEQKRLQVRTKPPKFLPIQPEEQDVAMEDGAGQTISSQPTPDLMPSNEDDSMSDDIADPREPYSSTFPAAIFSLGPSEFAFAVDKTPAFDRLLSELPLYEPTPVEPDLSKSNLAERLDSKWRTDIVPVSRWATEKLPVRDYKPLKKRSRYEYQLEPSTKKKSSILPPEENNVALFMPENKTIRDRIHPGHSFRPPSEHPMPSQAFFETRSSSQWTHTEDDELKKLVKDYSYNWSLISSCLHPRTSYTSGADRRTPWECFERWIGLEGLPADMSKTAYFKTYSGRIEAAGRHVAAQIEEAQRRAGANVQISNRKRTTQPVRVERKRTQRHLAMLDAMRKLAKKRETAIQKQQHQADLAAMRKVNDANVPKPSYKTPAEFSQLKQEREQKMAERQEIYRQQLIAHQRATAQQQRGQNAQPNGMPNAMPQAAMGMRGGGPPSAGGMPGMPNGNLQVPNGQPRPHPGIMAMQNNMQMPPGMMGPKGMTPQMQAQMQAAQMQARGQATSPQQMRILQEAQRVQQEQLMRQAQQAQNGAHSSPNNPHATLANGKGMNNPAYMVAMGGANGVPSPSGHMNGNSASPRPPSSGQALSSGHIPVLTQVANKIREHHPNLPEEDIQRLASQQISSYQQQATAAAAGQTIKRPPHNQAALNAAIGAVNAGNHASNAAAAAAAAAQYGHPGMMTNEQVQQYNQRMRMQQAQQNAARGMQGQIQGQMQPGMMGGMTNGMSNSPVMNLARPVSQHTNQGQMSRSATPRDQRSGSQSNPNGNVNGNGAAPQSSPRPAQPTMQA